jgi:ornithine cyclodeaminase/alanine dehydrogenase-like protein (mu-crystallin family)
MLVLTRSATMGLLELEEVIEAVEAAFLLHGRGHALEARRFPVPARDGGSFHVVAGGLAPPGAPATFALKCNAHFHSADGSPRMQGAIMLADAQTGEPVALLDSRVVTGLRTAAVTAVAARRLARPDASSALIVGAGRQAPGQVDALAAVLPLRHVAVHARDRQRAEAVADHARRRGLSATTAPDVRAAAARSDVIVTVTTARAPVLTDADVPPGCFVAAIGADAPGKQELDPVLLARCRVVVDVLAQCAAAGELAGALRAGTMGEADVHAELGAVVAGRRPGRLDSEERFVLDSTGTALQDAAASVLLLERARQRGRGRELDLAS